MSPQRENAVQRLVGWLRGGYPEGVPQNDYVALFGILHRDLTADEIEHVVLTLRADPSFPTDHSPIPDGRVRETIEKIVLEKPSDTDVARVRSRLASAGWPLAHADAPVDAAGDTPNSDEAAADEVAAPDSTDGDAAPIGQV